MLLAVSFVFAQGAYEAYLEESALVKGSVEASVIQDEKYGTISMVVGKNLTPYVFVPTAYSVDPDDCLSTVNAVRAFGESENIIAAANAGIFYNWGYGDHQTTEYCFNIKEGEGVIITNGQVLKSAESIDHTDCEPLVIDNSGNIGWADYWVDADALVEGRAYYYDIHGNKVDQSQDPDKYRIVSAVTGFVPILIDGVNQYDEEDTLLHGYHNYVGHYTQTAVRMVFVANDEVSGFISGRWDLNTAAEVAKALGFTFAYNLDGGGSSALVIGADTDGDGDVDADDAFASEYTEMVKSTRQDPTYIVFTSDNKAPRSSTPQALTAEIVDESVEYKAGEFGLYDIASNLSVKESFVNTDGSEGNAPRTIYTLAAAEEGYVTNAVYKKADPTAIVKISAVKAGTPYYTKSYDNPVNTKSGRPGQEPTLSVTDELTLCLRNNSNTRVSFGDTVGYTGVYYDYSTGYTLSTADDLTQPGAKTITVSYAGFTAEVGVTLK